MCGFDRFKCGFVGNVKGDGGTRSGFCHTCNSAAIVVFGSGVSETVFLNAIAHG